MNQRDALAHALLLAVEDSSGLWEVLWDLNTRYPDVPEGERREAAREAIRELARGGLISLHRCREPHGALSPIEPAEHEQVLQDDSHWEAPGPRSVSIRFEATPKGEQAFRDDRGASAG